MGLGGISVWQMLILLVIVVLLFGTKRIRTLGTDLGSALKGFRKGLAEDDGPSPRLEADPLEDAVEDEQKQSADAKAQP